MSGVHELSTSMEEWAGRVLQSTRSCGPGYGIEFYLKLAPSPHLKFKYSKWKPKVDLPGEFLQFHVRETWSLT